MQATCRSDILRNFIVDWDGSVFPCCNDFHKIFPIGQLRSSSVREVLDSPLRSQLAQQLDSGDWARIPTCSTCSWDKCAVELLGAGERSPRTTDPAPAASDSAEAKRLTSELQAVYSSTSWRLTQPLRAVGRLLGR